MVKPHASSRPCCWASTIKLILTKTFGISVIVFPIALAACGWDSPPHSRISVYEITGSDTERIAKVSSIIAKHEILPTAILDARFVEEQIGDGVLGPSDFRAFYFLAISPQDIAQWTQHLTPLDATVEYAAPMHAYDWWVSRDTFSSLQLYKPDSLTGRINGWIGVEGETGRIYIFTFTT